MKNGYFKLVNIPQGFGVKLFPAEDGGEAIQIMELVNYLMPLGIEYDVQALRRAVELNTATVFPLNIGVCPVRNEEYIMEVPADGMVCKVRFFPPSETGKRMPLNEFLRDLSSRNIKFGINQDLLNAHFGNAPVFGTTLVVAQGQEPRHGKDAVVEYFFNTDTHIQPTVREDGSVDYFQLNNINHVNKGDLLAKIIPEDPGDPGMTIQGNPIKPRDIKRVTLKFGNNIILSEDRMNLFSKVDGHVMLVEDRVFVSDVYQVENCDLSTGNIDFQGSVQVNGNVYNNMHIVAKGNVIINGVVEGAFIEAGGNITIARGMNGMSKGVLKAGGNVVAKFIENATVEAEGYVNTESILYSNISAGTDITVTGKKGFITGGHVSAGHSISVKTLGAAMGGTTIAEVGVNPHLKAEYVSLQRSTTDIVRAIKNAQPIIANFTEKRAKGVRFSADQIAYVKQTAALLEQKKQELTTCNEKMKELQAIFANQGKAEIIIQGVVCPGTTIVIADASMTVQSSCSYCKFEKRDGEIKMLPL